MLLTGRRVSQRVNQTRRRFLQLTGASMLATTAAGCLSAGSESDGHAAFFTLKDWATQVAGDTLEFETPVPVGQMGHGWEPDFEASTEIADASVFVYIDLPEFSWAQSAAETIDRDYPDVELINAIDGVDLLQAGTGYEPHDHDHVDIAELELVDRDTDDVIATYHDGHWDGTMPSIPEGETVSIGANITTDGDAELSLGDAYQLEAHEVDHEQDHLHIHSHGDHIYLEGETAGETAVSIQIVHDDHTEWESPPIEVTVGDGESDTNDDASDADDDHVHVGEFTLIDREAENVVAYIHGDHWHGGIGEIEVGDHRSLGATITDTDGHELSLGEDEPYSLGARVVSGEEYVSIDDHATHVEIHGVEEGTASLAFQLHHDENVVWQAAAIDVRIVTDAAETPVELLDPHAWVDPIRAQQMVDTIAVGVANADPDNAETYFDNADGYIDELQALHERFESELANRERDVVILAGHDSFQYLARRYDFEIFTPSGVSPDSSPSSSDIAETLDVIDEYEIDVVLTDIFEADDLAQTIVENSTATDIVEVTPAEGTTHEWDDDSWGYIEQMEEINLPAFKEALGAT